MAYDYTNPWGTGTAQERLDINRAQQIEVQVHGQIRIVRGRQVTLPTLAELIEAEKYLITLVNSESATAGSKTNYANRQRPL